MKTLPRIGFVALASALILAGCGGGAASQSTASARPSETAIATWTPATAASTSPARPAPSASPSLAAPSQVPSLAPPAAASAQITDAPSVTELPSVTAVAIGWFPASTTPCQPEGEAMGHSRFANPEQYARNLRCAVTLFGWPPGKVIDVEVVIQRWFDRATQEGGAGFEVGLEFTQMMIFNRCAWYLTWLEARQNGDAATEAAALDVMLKIIPNYESVITGFPANVFSPGSITKIREEVTRASLGDPSLVQQFVDVQCRAIPWQPS
jgi:hypothetical protein